MTPAPPRRIPYKLHYGIEYKDGRAPYGPSFWTKFVSLEKMVSSYLSNLVNDETRISYAFIATILEKRWLSKNNIHIMVLDCDGENEMLAACHWLKTEAKISYDLIQSSPGRYWVVTNYIGMWREIWEALRYIPGVCNAYRNEYCRKYKRMCLRAFPKIYNGRPTKPKFPTEFNTGPCAQEFIVSLQKYFDSEHYEKLMKAVFLHHHLKEKTMAEIAADPGFQL